MNRNYIGALFLTLVTLTSTFTNTITHSFPTLAAMQILFLKSFIGFLIISSLVLYKNKKLFISKCLHLQILKIGCGALGNLLWIKALQKLYLSEASFLSLFSAFFTTIGAHFILKEQSNRHIVFSLLLGLIGVILVVNPLTPKKEVILPLLSAAFFSASSLLNKKINLYDEQETTLIYLLAGMALLSLPSSLIYWQPLTYSQTMSLVSLGVIYLITQWLLIKAYIIAAAGFIGPFKFVRFPLSIISGLLFFNEVPSHSTLLGGGIILSAYLILHKARNMKVYGTT